MTALAPGAMLRRISNRWRRFTIEHFGQRLLALRSDVPYVSFTFDDFPRTALLDGGRILERHAVRGTYFVSGGLLGRPSPSGPIASAADLRSLLGSGHELGCHTFEHLDGTAAVASEFERSIIRNHEALTQCGVDAELSVFAYPLNGPVLSVKRAVGAHFAACRGGGQTFNAGTIDLNLLKAHFLDRRNNPSVDRVGELIRANAAARGWLIFATHDVARVPSAYGCDPAFFEEIVRLAVNSGARVLPMAEVCRAVGAATLVRRARKARSH